MKRFLSKSLIVAVVFVASLAANVGIMAATDTTPSIPTTQSRLNPRVVFTPKPYTISVKISGQKSGVITNNTKVLSMSHTIISPRDPASGLPTGQRMHKPFLITKELDRTSPLLENVLCTNENLPEVLLTFSDGNPKDTYTIRLTNANIASIVLSGGTDNNDQVTEDIAFTYQKIEWLWAADGTAAMDDWEGPVE